MNIVYVLSYILTFITYMNMYHTSQTANYIMFMSVSGERHQPPTQEQETHAHRTFKKAGHKWT